MKNWRINLISVFLILFSAAVIGRLIYLQILHSDFYKALAQGQQKIISVVQGDRGKIFFKGGETLATNIKGEILYISPREIENKEETAKIITETLEASNNVSVTQQENISYDRILEKTKEDNLFTIIKSKLTEEEIDSFKKASLPGVYLGEEVFRNYPQDSLASHIIGFVDRDGKGQYGIEGYYDDVLQGKEGFQKRARAPLEYFSIDSDNEGTDLFLTLDYNIQFQAEKLLKEAYQNRNFEEGTIIVVDPNSGRILALANFPNFDPNQYSKEENLAIFQNSATQKTFEPGSVLKPITMASAINEGKITPQTTYVDKGYVKIGGYTISNFQKQIWGECSMTKVLERSINTGAVFAEEQLGDSLFLKYLENFDFFEKTGIDLQGEVFSLNSEFKKGYEINFATASFGQGIEMTPIQLVKAFCSIANGGRLVKPYLVEKIVNGSDDVIEIQTEISENPIITQTTASQVTEMMVSTIENGYGKKAQIPGYYIAGKTGTAQIAYSSLGEKKSGYSEKTIQSFIGFAPAFNPQFLILVKFTDPKTESAVYSVAPVFHEMAKYIIDYWQIPPDYE